MKEKTAECVNLPITINKRATISISSKDGIIASTGKIEKIIMIQFYKGYIYVTFQTHNSIYKNVPLYLWAEDSRMFEGEYIRPRDPVMTDNGYVTVNSIEKIDTNGIIIKDQNGNYQKSSFWV